MILYMERGSLEMFGPSSMSPFSAGLSPLVQGCAGAGGGSEGLSVSVGGVDPERAAGGGAAGGGPPSGGNDVADAVSDGGAVVESGSKREAGGGAGVAGAGSGSSPFAGRVQKTSS